MGVWSCVVHEQTENGQTNKVNLGPKIGSDWLPLHWRKRMEVTRGLR